MPTLMLIDGNSLTYRAFHALPQDLATASGQVTNAVFGFTSMLINLVRDHQPDGIAVAFDRPEPTFRHEQVETYKANRSAAPDILRQQMGLVREVLDALMIPQLELVGFEADDILATLASRAAAEKIDVLLVTGDRDSYQLVADPYVRVVYNKRGVSDYALYDEAGILERTGVEPTKYVQYAALRGDPSDNLPGVPGVGEKTAAKLLNKYGDIDGIYEHLDEQTPKLKENLAAAEDQVRINTVIMELLRDLDLEVEVEALLGRQPYDGETVRKLFDFLEFRTLYARFEEAFGDQPGSDAVERTVILSQPVAASGGDAIAKMAALAASDDPVAVAGAFDESSEALAGIALVPANGAEPSADVVWLSVTDLAEPAMVEARSQLFGPDGPGVVAHDGKKLLRALMDQGIEDIKLVFDNSLAAYLLDPAGNSYPLVAVLETYTDYAMPEGAAAPEGQLDFGDAGRTPADVAAAEAIAVALAMASLSAQIETDGLTQLNNDVEVPLVEVLARMEHEGIAADVDRLSELNQSMTDEAQSLSRAIQESAGEDFNVNSTKKLREILFEKLELTPQKKTKTGYSTDQATLEKLSGEHPIIDQLLRYREVEKLRSTYGQPLVDAVDDDGRIHATFNQTVARTGRLSSENPNLHNIPVRSELGRTFREAFVASEGCRLVVADYNQIELRCIAHLADDPGLIEAFRANDDIHSITAARVFEVEPEDVTFEQRSKAKMVSYGLAYGMEAYGLGQRLGIATSEAQSILAAYFEGFPAVRQYMDDTVTEARNRGYTETLFGRRRAIPELMSDNRNVRQAGERQAMNAGIQGLAADIFKVALIRLDKLLRQGRHSTKVVLQVHDEVILDAPNDEVGEIQQMVDAEMSAAFELRVPLAVNIAVGETWADCKD